MNKILTKLKSFNLRENLIAIISIPVLIILLLASYMTMIPNSNFIIGALVIILSNILVELHYIKIKLDNK